MLSLISVLWEQRIPTGAVQNPHKYKQAGILLKCKIAKQMRSENSLGRLLNFAFVISQKYCHASPCRTWTNGFFKHFSGRHKRVFMVTMGRYKRRLANMKIKFPHGCHVAVPCCVKSRMERTTLWWYGGPVWAEWQSAAFSFYILRDAVIAVGVLSAYPFAAQ